MEVKVGIWVNSEKMRNILDKLSMFYALFICLTGIITIWGGMEFVGIIEIIASMPLWIIVYSKGKYDKIKWKEAKG